MPKKPQDEQQVVRWWIREKHNLNPSQDTLRLFYCRLSLLNIEVRENLKGLLITTFLKM